MATIPEGTINDATTSLSSVWSSQKTADELANKISASSADALTNKVINFSDNTPVGFQAELESGVSIKTINGQPVLGSGDLAIPGAWTLLSTVTASNSATVNIETTFDGAYDAYVILASGVTVSNVGRLYAFFKQGGSYLGSGSR